MITLKEVSKVELLEEANEFPTSGLGLAPVFGDDMINLAAMRVLEDCWPSLWMTVAVRCFRASRDFF